MSSKEIPRPAKSLRGGGTSTTNSVSLTAEQLVEIERQYGNALMRNGTLLDEVTFILTERLNTSGIKIHGIERRNAKLRA
jgi:hypothetical protein